MASKIILNEKVTIRDLNEGDIQYRVNTSTSPEIAKMYGFEQTQVPDPWSFERSKKWYESLADKPYVKAICIDGKLAGAIFLHSLNTTDRNARMAMGLFEEHNLGQGMGRTALKFCLDHAFGEMNLHRVELRVLAYNHRAIKCYEACGFKHEGALRDNALVGGVWHDDFMMSILEDEYRAIWQ